MRTHNLTQTKDSGSSISLASINSRMPGKRDTLAWITGTVLLRTALFVLSKEI